MKEFDLFIENAKAIDEQGVLIDLINIGIKNGIIEYMGSHFYNADTIIDAKGKIITPTFANAHAHSPMNILKGIAEDSNLADWFNTKIFPYESILSDNAIHIGTELAINEMINSGISVYAEHYFNEDIIIETAKTLGIKLDIAPTVFGGEDSELRIQKTIELKEKYYDSKIVNVSFGPHSTYMCSDIELKRIGYLAKKHKMKVHLHIGETKAQFEEHIKRYSETPIETLKRTGILDSKTLLAHNLHFDMNDLKLLNEDHAIILCPKTYMKLAMDMNGVFPVLDQLNWYFGTDGSASSNTLDVVEQSRLMGLISKYHLKDATQTSVKDLWIKLMKTHDVLGFNTGKLKVGFDADLILWDLNDYNTLSHHNVLSSIIYSSNSNNVETVIIDGIIKKSKGILHYDLEDLTKRLNDELRLIFNTELKGSIYKF